LLKNNFQEYHILIILDEPNFNGLEIAKTFVENKIANNYLIFMFSSNHKTDNYIQSKRSGVDYYMTQPFEQDDFTGYLEDYLPNVTKRMDIEQKVVRQDLSILVAEDNVINQKVAETIFGNLGFKIDISPDGADTVEKVKQKNYDIIFMDILMPEKDGIQATVDIRGMGYQMPIVAMTATSSKKSRHKAISSGMNDFIIKPFKMDTINKILIKWFA
jgi:CheY-like chemotaxis protein